MTFAYNLQSNINPFKHCPKTGVLTFSTDYDERYAEAGLFLLTLYKNLSLNAICLFKILAKISEFIINNMSLLSSAKEQPRLRPQGPVQCLQYATK